MHELSLLTDLLRQIDSVARLEKAAKVTRVKVKVGALCHLSAAHLQEHFLHAARGTIAEDATLEIEVLTDTAHPQAQDLVLDSVEVETSR